MAHGLDPDFLTIGKAIGGGVPIGAQVDRHALAFGEAIGELTR